MRRFVAGEAIRGHFGCSLAAAPAALYPGIASSLLAVGNCGAGWYASAQLPGGLGHLQAMPGGVHILETKSLLSIKGSVALPLLGGSLSWGRAPLGRFGTHVLFVDVDGDGRPELVASAPYENGAPSLFFLHRGPFVPPCLVAGGPRDAHASALCEMLWRAGGRGALAVMRQKADPEHKLGRWEGCWITGTHDRARMGHALALTTTPDEYVLVVGSPRWSSAAGEMQGMWNLVLPCRPV